jgi:hypothetical protein
MIMGVFVGDRCGVLVGSGTGVLVDGCCSVLVGSSTGVLVDGCCGVLVGSSTGVLVDGCCGVLVGSGIGVLVGSGEGVSLATGVVAGSLVAVDVQVGVARGEFGSGVLVSVAWRASWAAMLSGGRESMWLTRKATRIAPTTATFM